MAGLLLHARPQRLRAQHARLTTDTDGCCHSGRRTCQTQALQVRTWNMSNRTERHTEAYCNSDFLDLESKDLDTLHHMWQRAWTPSQLQVQHQLRTGRSWGVCRECPPGSCVEVLHSHEFLQTSFHFWACEGYSGSETFIRHICHICQYVTYNWHA